VVRSDGEAAFSPECHLGNPGTNSALSTLPFAPRDESCNALHRRAIKSGRDDSIDRVAVADEMFENRIEYVVGR
jgi:hypothetical protein